MKKTTMTILAAGFAFAALGAPERVRLDKGWTFKLDREAAPRAVTVPHDWSIEYGPDASAPSLAGGGYYPCGKGEYTTEIELSEDDLAKNLSLFFEGVYRDARVEVNGREAGRGTFYGYTWFRIDLNGFARAGKNTVRVLVDNSALPNTRWYSGSGIYRHVWLEKRETNHVIPGTLFIRTVSADDKRAVVEITGTITNTVRHTSKDVSSRFTLENPVLWTPENPKLHDFSFHGEKVRYGIRTVAWDAKKGFLLNGRPVILHGACVHHDHGPLGAASYDEAERRKVLQLKRGGFNAVRTSHAPVSEAFLDACDEEGILVMDDMFDGWRKPKTAQDYCTRFESEWRRDLETIVRRDRNHPSVVMWSIGNEVLERTSPWAAEQAKRMVDVCHELGPDLPVTSALCSWGPTEWRDQDKLASNLDIVGYNYMEHETENDHRLFPDRVMVYTETYPRNVVDVWKRIVAYPHVIGEFVWTGIDYLGEGSIGRTCYEGVEECGEHWIGRLFPWHGGYCGDIDLTGYRKPVSHLRETLWNESAPTYMAVREPDGWKGKIKTSLWSPPVLLESWTFGGWEGKPVEVEVYTRKPNVRLSLNGKIVGETAVSAATAWTAKFTLPYAPGELKAEALDANGRVDETFTLRTAGAAASIRWSSERIGNLEWVVAEIVDKDGTVCPDAAIDVTFDGDVIATCSGDMRDQTPATTKTRRTWQGRAMAVRRVK